MSQMLDHRRPRPLIARAKLPVAANVSPVPRLLASPLRPRVFRPLLWQSFYDRDSPLFHCQPSICEYADGFWVQSMLLSEYPLAQCFHSIFVSHWTCGLKVYG